MSPPVDIIARHEDLPSRSAAVAAVLRVVDDPDADAADVSRAIGSDPALTARVLRVANSPYYGLSGRVGTLPFAVSVIGFQAIRGIAVAAASGLDSPDAAPPGFWPAAATAATTAELIAPVLGVHPGDAFCLGLLHTLGSALLHQHHPLPAQCLPGPVDDAELAREEMRLYGIGHAEAGARVLAAWKFPAQLCDLIARHHEPALPDASALERLLPVARALTQLAMNEIRDAGGEHTIARLTEGRIADRDIPGLMHRVTQRTRALLEGLGSN